MAAVEARQRTYSAPVSTLRQLTDNTAIKTKVTEANHTSSTAAATTDRAPHPDEPKTISTPGPCENPQSQLPSTHPAKEFVSPVAQDTTKVKRQQIKKKGLKK